MITVQELAKRYEVERMPDRAETARVFLSWLRNYVLPEWGAKPVSEIQPRPVELWLRSLQLSHRSKGHVRYVLFRLLDYAMWCGAIQIAKDPIDFVKLKDVTKRMRKPRSLTAEEFQRLITELRTPFGTIAIVCACFGLRISECLGLRWSDVDWLNGTLTVERGIVRQIVNDVKTEGSRKSLPIASELLQRLQAWKQMTIFSTESDWMFASPVKLGRQPYSYTGVWRELQRAAEATGIGKLGTHSWRHSCRSWLDAVGTKPTVQQKMMRHADIRTTFNTYGDVVTDEMQEAHSKVVGFVLSA